MREAIFKRQLTDAAAIASLAAQANYRVVVVVHCIIPVILLHIGRERKNEEAFEISKRFSRHT